MHRAAVSTWASESCVSSIMGGEDEVRVLEAELREGRRQLRIHKKPVKVLRLFCLQTGSWAGKTFHLMVTHWIMTSFVLPLLALWYFLEFIPQYWPFEQEIDHVEKLVKFVIWWVGLGILSSIGLGTGIHSGMLFLFPHIMMICLAAEECGSVRFESIGNMWLRRDPHLFACPEDDAEEKPLSYLSVFLKVYPPCLLWGIGTAIGEIPPYAVSRAAAKAGEHLEQMDELDDLERKKNKEIAVWDVVTRMKIWMVKFLHTHGFMGVLLMSSWPNMAFDLCGICCGHFQMPFWTFFGATLLGKAGFKILGQACFFTMLFTETHMKSFVSIIRLVTPPSWGLGDLLQDALLMGKSQFHTRSKKQPSSGLAAQIKSGWHAIMMITVALFAISCIEQFAQMRAATADAVKVAELRKKLGLPLTRPRTPVPSPTRPETNGKNHRD